MKNLGIIGFAMAALVLVGCSSNKSGSMGAVNSSESCSSKSECCEGQKKDAAMGAVGEKKLYTKPEELLIRSHKNLHKVYTHLRFIPSNLR